EGAAAQRGGADAVGAAGGADRGRVRRFRVGIRASRRRRLAEGMGIAFARGLEFRVRLERCTRLSSLATLPRARIPQVRSGAVRTRVGTRRGLRDRGLGGGGDQSGNGKGQGGALHVDSPPRGPPILGASGGGKPFQTRYRCLTRAFSRCASTPCQRETCGGLTPLVAAAAAAAPG